MKSYILFSAKENKTNMSRKKMYFAIINCETIFQCSNILICISFKVFLFFLMLVMFAHITFYFRYIVL